MYPEEMSLNSLFLLVGCITDSPYLRRHRQEFLAVTLCLQFLSAILHLLHNLLASRVLLGDYVCRQLTSPISFRVYFYGKKQNPLFMGT